MKLRTIGQLGDYLDEESSWRKKEISRISMLATSESNPDVRAVFDRWGTVVVYGHYEGFIKSTTLGLFNFVSHQGLRYKNLATSYLVACSKASIREAASSDRLHVYGQVIDFLVFGQENKAKVPFTGVVDTRDNLSSRVLADIFYTIGETVPSSFEVRSKIIDEILLKNRNAVAHGNRDRVNSTDFETCKEMVLQIFDEYKAILSNCAATKRYTRI